MELPDRFNDCKAQEERACEILDAPTSVIAFEPKSSLCRDFVPVFEREARVSFLS